MFSGHLHKQTWPQAIRFHSMQMVPSPWIFWVHQKFKLCLMNKINTKCFPTFLNAPAVVVTNCVLFWICQQIWVRVQDPCFTASSRPSDSWTRKPQFSIGIAVNRSCFALEWNYNILPSAFAGSWSAMLRAFLHCKPLIDGVIQHTSSSSVWLNPIWQLNQWSDVSKEILACVWLIVFSLS